MQKLKRLGILRLLAAFGVIYLVFTLVPAGVYALYRQEEQTPAQSPLSTPEPSPSSFPSSSPSSAAPGFLEGFSLPQNHAVQGAESFSLYDAATGQVLHVPAEEFLPAALACEMDLSVPREALKAQAVAIYTLYTRQRGQATAPGGADISCDTANWLVYVPRSAMEERWGEKFAEYHALLREVTEEVRGQLLTWEGKPILAAYFAISSGATQEPEQVWEQAAQGDFPYLRPVASPGDLLCDGYLSSRTLTGRELQEQMEAAFPQLDFDWSGPEESWLANLEYNPSGYVTRGTVGGQALSGKDLRSALSLRSAAFSCSWDQSYTLETKGWGHGVGLSQAGAVFLAKQGQSYRDILAHYYPGAQLTGGA